MIITFLDTKDVEQATLSKALTKHKVNFIAKHIDHLVAEDYAQLKDTEILSIFTFSKLTSERLKQFPNLKYIATRSTGYDHIDLEYCAKKKIQVSNVPFYGENTVAEHAFALLLALSRRLVNFQRRVDHSDFSTDGLTGFDLRNKTIGVIGAGNIGKNILRIARGFGMKRLAYDINYDIFLSETLEYHYVELKTLLKNSDIIIVTAPYNKATHHMINLKNVAQIKRGAYLINVARGALIETAALKLALDKNILAGAGLDVLEEENQIIKSLELSDASQKNPIFVANKDIIDRYNVIFTPHIAFNTTEAVARITATTIENIDDYVNGAVKNLVK